VVGVTKLSAYVHGAGAADQFGGDGRRTVGTAMAIIRGKPYSRLRFNDSVVN
jgi:hypothetical protein